MSRAGAARIVVKQDGVALWRLVVVRPAASSGTRGSGVELRGVSYRGTRVCFGAVDSCVCNTHHHAYGRLDFDIAGPAHDVVAEHNDPPPTGHDVTWHRLTHEIRRTRDPCRKRRWRVRNRATC